MSHAFGCFFFLSFTCGLAVLLPGADKETAKVSETEHDAVESARGRRGKVASINEERKVYSSEVTNNDFQKQFNFVFYGKKATRTKNKDK